MMFFPLQGKDAELLMKADREERRKERVMRKAFLCLDDEIVSTNDGQKHRIPGDRLHSLYGVNRGACVVARTIEEFRNDPRFLGVEGNEIIVLRPRSDGLYAENCPYNKVPDSPQVYAMLEACSEVNWVPGDARCILADALQDADYQDSLLLTDLRSSSSDIDTKPFIDALFIMRMARGASQSLMGGTV